MDLEKLHDTSWKEEILSITDDSVRVRANFNGESVIYNISRHPTFTKENHSKSNNHESKVYSKTRLSR